MFPHGCRAQGHGRDAHMTGVSTELKSSISHIVTLRASRQVVGIYPKCSHHGKTLTMMLFAAERQSTSHEHH